MQRQKIQGARLTPLEEEEVRALLAAGLTATEVARKLDGQVTFTAIAERIPTPDSPEHAAIRAERQKHPSIKATAKALGVTYHRVRKALRAGEVAA